MNVDKLITPDSSICFSKASGIRTCLRVEFLRSNCFLLDMVRTLVDTGTYYINVDLPKMLLAHKIELRPTKEQEAFLFQSVGVRRFVYNALSFFVPRFTASQQARNTQVENGSAPRTASIAASRSFDQRNVFMVDFFLSNSLDMVTTQLTMVVTSLLQVLKWHNVPTNSASIRTGRKRNSLPCSSGRCDLCGTIACHCVATCTNVVVNPSTMSA